MKYQVNEIFGPTFQGEGARKGTVNLWLRFAGCNLTCKTEVEGFDCDTDFSGGRPMSSTEIVAALDQLRGPVGATACRWVVASGGEPGLQLDKALIDSLHDAKYHVAVETNGTQVLPLGVDWISCSPKTAEHTLRVGDVDELRYVRAYGQSLPKPRLRATHLYVSPAFEPDGTLKAMTLEWCKNLCIQDARWALSVQEHKLLGVR